jgi:hypothetical protein
MPKLQENGGRYFITLPLDIVRKKKWSKGTKLVISFNERGNVEIEDIK